ncbi:hypothetical protein KC19_10G029800 [Ceratodon purpureus]|uniref:Uncharacterized protein n=1 Tax=Ceratodon purpureus TaxID=3225 RepID=A0A8T0GL51_CERPU|nr:hypothetical protein KC19_10G029800 [Ceratodon purpureus]
MKHTMSRNMISISPRDMGAPFSPRDAKLKTGQLPHHTFGFPCHTSATETSVNKEPLTHRPHSIQRPAPESIPIHNTQPEPL